jgi:RNA polymerase sigma-70 factor (ECF subfamily)
MDSDDAAVLARAKDGDEDAFRLLVERHGRNVYRLALRITGTKEDAEDVVQETLVRAYRQLGRFESRANVGTWLYRIGFNCAIDHLRARGSRPDTGEVEDLPASGAEGAPPPADALVYAGEIGARVRAALRDLSVQERTAFVLRHYHGCGIAEIATVLDATPSAAKHAIFRAVRKLRATLGPVLAGAADRTEAQP